MVRTGRLALVLVSLGSVVARCGAPASVRVRTTARSYAPGEPVVLRIANRGIDTVYSDPCAGEIDAAPLLGRPAAGPGSARACTEMTLAERRAVAPGAIAVDTLLVSGNAGPGLWRARLMLRNAHGALLPEEAGTSNRFRDVRGDRTAG